MNIIPAINGEYKQAQQKLVLPRILTINSEPHAPVSLFCSRMGSTGVSVQAAEKAFIKLIHNESLMQEQYIINVKQGDILVEFSSENGLFNALATLYQLLTSSEIYCCTINDSPRYEYRGVHIDTARHFFECDEIKKIIEQLSLLKINRLHWHFADDQAWRLEIQEYPLLTKPYGTQIYTQLQAKDIVQYAKNRGVEVIPELEIPAHSTALVAMYPNMSCRSAKVAPPKNGGIFKIIMCGGKVEAYSFIKSTIAELCQIFEGEHFHIGGDEAPKKEWKKCPHCMAKMQQLGISSYEQLQGHILNYATDILHSHGKKTICWNDSLKADNLNKNIIVQYWQHKSKAKINVDQKLILSNLLPFYFDYPYCVSNLKNVYNYLPNIKGKRVQAQNILGAECTLWAERIATNERLEYMMFPRVIALAEKAWCANGDYKDFTKRLKIYYIRLKRANICAAPLKNSTVKGFLRLFEIIKFGIIMSRAFISLILPEKIEY